MNGPTSSRSIPRPLGAVDAGFPDNQLEIIVDPLAAISRAFMVVQPGDLIVVKIDDFESMLSYMMTTFRSVSGFSASYMNTLKQERQSVVIRPEYLSPHRLDSLPLSTCDLDFLSG